MPLVSVVIAAFNPGEYLRGAIDSVRAQTHRLWEVVVVDDGSTEDLSWVGRLMPEVRLIRQANAGQAAARNVGVAATAGAYVAFLDQDDVWMPEKISRQVAVMERSPEMGLVHTQFEFINHAGGRTAEGFGRQQTFGEMLEGSGICGASTVMVRREALKRVGMFDPATQPAEDFDLWLRLARDGATGFVPECLVQYRLHDQNQTRQYERTYQAVREILRKYDVKEMDPAIRQSARKGMRRIRSTFAAQAFDQAREARRRREWAGCAGHLARSFQLKPAFLLKALVGK